MSSEYTHPSTDQRHSLDSQPPQRVNRASVQTTFTEAPTESTFSPTSPITSSFAGQGLAPRPPSDQRPIARGPPPMDDPDRRPRRMPYDDHPYGMQPAPEPPAAPDVPRQPPLSYRPRYSNPVNAHATPPVSSGYPSNSRAYPSQMAAAQEQQHRSRQDMQWPPNMATPGHAPPESRSVPANVLGQQRRTSASASSDRRKKLTNGQSPLQRLELTLDSMTKEEKRARVAAAEQRARERAARNAESLTAAADTDALARSASERSPRPPQPPSSQLYHPGPAAPLTERRQSLPHGSGPGERGDSRALGDMDPQHYDPRLAQPAELISSIPKRNLSFRDRARAGGVSSEAEATSSPQAAAATQHAAPTRSGSNKLRKEPPDSLSQRQRAEPPGVPRPVAQQHVRQAPQLSPNTVPRPSRDKDLPPLPAPSREQNPTSVDPIIGREYGSDEEYIPRPRQRTVQIQEQVEGDPDDDMALARRRLQRGDSYHAAQQPQTHRVSNLIFKNPEAMRPGDGLYNPPEWLDEWKKGAVGTLSGSLLEVDASQGSKDTYKAWWEDGSRRKGTNVTARLRKAEAFDGEYDDTNNGE